MTARPFLISGLPRSRTAWASVLCTTQNSICYHEPCVKFKKWDDLVDLYQRETPKFVGVSDSSVVFLLPWILETIQPRTVIIERNVGEVKASLDRLGIPSGEYLELSFAALKAIRNHPLVMWVPYRALEIPRIVQRMFAHLLPGEPFDEDRYELLAKMRIVTDFEKTVRAFNQQKPQLELLMQDMAAKMRLVDVPTTVVH